MESEITGGLMMGLMVTPSAPTSSSVLPLGTIEVISPLLWMEVTPSPMNLDQGLREKDNTTSAIGLGAANRLPATKMERKEEGRLVAVGFLQFCP
jgi:hypothetical protein